jgi:hypothetical protein
MQTHTHKLFHGRKTPPSFAGNVSELKLLLARAMELRARIYSPRNDSPEKRIRFAQRKLHKDRPALVTLRNSVAAQMNGGSPERCSALERRLKTYNGELAISKNAAVILCGIVHWYFRVGLSSQECAVAMRNVVAPGSIRKIASELVKLWQQMQSGKDRQRKPTPVKPAKRVHIRKTRQTRQSAQKAVWADPEKRARRIASLKAAFSTPEARARRSAAMKAAWAGSGVRERRSAAMKAAFSTPEARAAQSARSKVSQNRPDVQEKRSASLKATAAMPEARARRSAASKAAKTAWWARWRAERALADALIEHVHELQ